MSRLCENLPYFYARLSSKIRTNDTTTLPLLDHLYGSILIA